MSLAAINELLSACDGKRQLVELAGYAEDLCNARLSAEELGDAPDTEAAQMWGSVVKHVVTRVLCNLDACRSEKDMRALYSTPLRVFVSALHTTCRADAVFPPLTPTSVDLLYQHIAHVLRLPKAACCATDYCACLTSLSRLRKYGYWMQPQRLLELTACLRTLLDAGVGGDKVAAAYHSVLGVYPRGLPREVVAATLATCGDLLARSHADPAAQQGALHHVVRVMRLVVVRCFRDSLAPCRAALERVSPYLLSILSRQRSNEALQQSVFSLYLAAFDMCDFLNECSAGGGGSDDSAGGGGGSGGSSFYHQPTDCEAIWAAARQVLSLSRQGYVRADMLAHDARTSDLVAVLSCTATVLCRSRAAREAPAAAAPAAGGARDVSLLPRGANNKTALDAAGGGGGGGGGGKRLRRSGVTSAWDVMLAGVGGCGDALSLAWLRVLEAFLRRQLREGRGGRRAGGATAAAAAASLPALSPV
eukprot:Rhum_TRINITY_DN7534_c0_g1::Rhum_TRINITY_DN7534_c0_g1_i1::g.23239::m.23239